MPATIGFSLFISRLSAAYANEAHTHKRTHTEKTDATRNIPSRECPYKNQFRCSPPESTPTRCTLAFVQIILIFSSLSPSLFDIPATPREPGSGIAGSRIKRAHLPPWDWASYSEKPRTSCSNIFCTWHERACTGARLPVFGGATVTVLVTPAEGAAMFQRQLPGEAGHLPPPIEARPQQKGLWFSVDSWFFAFASEPVRTWLEGTKPASQASTHEPCKKVGNKPRHAPERVCSIVLLPEVKTFKATQNTYPRRKQRQTNQQRPTKTQEHTNIPIPKCYMHGSCKGTLLGETNKGNQKWRKASKTILLHR